MKYCEKCGAEMADNANFCPKCGHAAAKTEPFDEFAATNGTPAPAPSEPRYGTYAPPPAAQNSGIRTAAKVFMILGCVFSGFYLLIPLLWTIPMTVYYFGRIKNGLPVGTGFKICSLLFVSLVGGILMLCDSDDGRG